MCFDRQKFSLRGGLKVDDEANDEDHRGFKSGLSSSQHVCHVYLCVNVVELHITKEHPNYWEL